MPALAGGRPRAGRCPLHSAVSEVGMTLTSGLPAAGSRVSVGPPLSASSGHDAGAESRPEPRHGDEVERRRVDTLLHGSDAGDRRVSDDDRGGGQGAPGRGAPVALRTQAIGLSGGVRSYPSAAFAKDCWGDERSRPGGDALGPPRGERPRAPSRVACRPISQRARQPSPCPPGRVSGGASPSWRLLYRCVGVRRPRMAWHQDRGQEALSSRRADAKARVIGPSTTGGLRHRVVVGPGL